MPKQPSPEGRTADAKAIGERLKRARLEAGLNQRELAERLEVSERSISAYENGDVVPWRHMRPLEDVLECSKSWILHGNEAQHKSREGSPQSADLEARVEALERRGLIPDPALSSHHPQPNGLVSALPPRLKLLRKIIDEIEVDLPGQKPQDTLDLLAELLKETLETYITAQQA